MGLVELLVLLRRRNIAQRFHQALAVVPGHPLQCGELDVLEVLPRPQVVDNPGLIEAIDCLGERVVVCIAAVRSYCQIWR